MFLQVDEQIQIHYEIFEHRLPQDTFFIHGNIASNRWWYPTMELLPEDAHLEGRAILMEFRGCGQSTAPSSLEQATMEIFANDFIKIIEHVGSKNFNLVGHSTGGFIACLIAAQMKARVNHLVALDPVGAHGVQFEPSMEVAFNAMKADSELVAAVIGATIYNNDPNSDFFKKIILPDACIGAKNVGLFVIKNLDGVDIKKQVQAITAKCLFLHGEHDSLLPKNDTQELARLSQNGTFAEIPNQGHCCNIENAKTWTKILKNFLQKSEMILQSVSV